VSGIKSSYAEEWRTGGRIKLNVYEGDRPVCQCHDEEGRAQDRRRDEPRPGEPSRAGEEAP